MHGSSQPSVASSFEFEKEILSLYESSQYVEAYRRLESQGGLDSLVGPSGRALAGRLASNLGADRYGAAIHLRAWRQTPDANALGFFAGMNVGRLWGPVRAIEMLDRMLEEDLTPRGISDITSAKAYQLASLRDFDSAEQALAQGLEAEGDRAWLLVTKGYLLNMQDQPEEAIAALRESLERRPMYRPAVQSLASTLIQQNHVEEAQSLLTEASEQLQCGNLLLQLAQLERELMQYESAQQRLEDALPLLPLREKDRDSSGGYTGFAATLAYDVGQIDEAIRLSEESGRPFHTTVAENLRKNRTTGRRVLLDVGFTLQEEMTCVPATISTLMEFWGEPAAHLDIAEAICYDGTPAHAERTWLERKGFFCREFTLTWETAIALIDAGLPFTQTLTGYSMGHMQAVIGYDSFRGVLIYRDPSVRCSGEVLGKELLEQMRSTGPRGMVFVPSSERHRVEAMDLPDHLLWTHSHEVSRALAEHDRDAAASTCERMQAEAPEHRLTTHAQARIASYDGDLRTLHKLTDQLLEEFPNDQNQWSVKLRLMKQLGSRSERLEVLEGLCDQSDCELVYRHQLIDELLSDPHEMPRVDYLLRRCRRAGAVDGPTATLEARRAWIADDRELAMRWYRYAACLDTRTEERSATYFAVASALNRTDEALVMLQDRFERFRTHNSGPGISLAQALDQVLKTQQAGQVLRSAIEARPDDGDLRLFACNFLMRLGRLDKAKRQLEKAKDQCHAADWLATAAALSQQDNRLEEAYEFLCKSLERSPLSLGTHRHVVQVLADLRGAEAAIEHLNTYIEQFPKNLDLRTMLVEACSEVGPERAEEAAREHLKLHPNDAWCWRELGFKLAEQRRWEEALLTTVEADRHEPKAMQNRVLKGMIHVGRGEEPLAREEFLAAIRISVDYAPAITELLQLCDTRSERQEALGHVLTELKTQVILGQTLHHFRAYASKAYEPDEALRILEEARAARPDLWQTSSVVVEQLVAMKRVDEALATAKMAVNRFPLLPSVRVDLANVYRELGQSDKEIKQLRHALAINSRNGETLRSLAEAYGRCSDFKREQDTLQRACDSEPRNITHRGALAELFWRQGQRDVAIATIREALEQEPAYEWGWDRLADWSLVAGQPELLISMAREITEKRPKSPQAWLQQAELLARFPEHGEESLAAIDRVLELDPRLVNAHEHRALLLANFGQFDQAIAACEPEALGQRPPTLLRARAAVIESQRGEIDKAIARMRAVLDDDPDYAYAWSQLAGWLQQQGQPKEALAAAKRLLEVAPRASASWGYVAECLADQGEREEAKIHLARSIELDSAYLYGGQGLIAMQIDDEEYDGALETLAIIGPHLTDHDRAANEARLQGLANRQEEALAAFRRASCLAADSDGVLLEAADALLLKGWANPLKSLLQEEIAERRASPPAVSVLVEVLSREAKLAAIEELCESLDTASPHWAEGVSAYLEALGDAQAEDRISAFVAPRAEALRRQSRSWGLVGAAYQRSDRLRKAVDWMSDWPQRNDTEPHQFVPLAIAYLELGDLGHAKEVVDHAVAMPMAPATDTLRVLGASAEVMDGDPQAAAIRLELVAPQNLGPYYLSLYALQRAGSHGALELDQKVRWRDISPAWSEAYAEYNHPEYGALFNVLVAHSRLLLTRRRGNPLRTWLAERKARRDRAALNSFSTA